MAGHVYFAVVPRLKWVLLPLIALACRGPFPQSTLDPRSDYGAAIDALFTTIFGWAVVVFVLVEGLLLFAIVRYRARPGAPTPRPLHGHTALEIGWTLAPALILVFIAVPTMRTIFDTAGHAPAGALRVEVIGHQWWWEYRYPSLGITAVNELHLPAGTPVQLDMTSADVIHSFWVPQLGGKRDLTQGHVTRVAFRADSTGSYLGQCAEFCGVSHANMRLRVFVQSAADFEGWVARQRAVPAAPARGSPAARGREVFGRSACIACHMVGGLPSARGTLGPDLTHVGSRTTIASGLFPNAAEYLRPWILNAPAMKPGALMTPQALSDEDLSAIVAYLQSLR
jgi:cytochrome c oxidase subunit 2